nr:unnamed protein product [Callosobruchus chinensis]
MDKNHLMPLSQYGFHKGHSTQELLCKLITNIQIGFTLQKHTSVAFLDVTGAYDNVNYSILSSKMNDYAISVKNKNIAESIIMLESALISAQKWFADNGSPIAHEKSAICTFTRTRYQPSNIIRIAESDFPYKQSIKYLGMILDRKLLWKEHL